MKYRMKCQIDQILQELGYNQMEDQFRFSFCHVGNQQE